MSKVDYLTLILLALGLSFDDFGLAFALSLLIPSEKLRERMIHAGKMAIAFSASTVMLPLLGWLLGLVIYKWIASFSAWVVLIVFCGVGVWIIKEAFEDEQIKLARNVSSFWALMVFGTLGSFDEGAVGIGFPFLGTPILWIIIAVVLTNTVLIYLAVFLSGWIKRLSKRIPSILSGSILIALGIIEFLDLILPNLKR
ncbi:manganese efflux pump MntP [Pseudothermotoga sp.]|nr:manganese efflux pump MntP family protein [Pseudothermotoga sp.]